MYWTLSITKWLRVLSDNFLPGDSAKDLFWGNSAASVFTAQQNVRREIVTSNWFLKFRELLLHFKTRIAVGSESKQSRARMLKREERRTYTRLTGSVASGLRRSLISNCSITHYSLDGDFIAISVWDFTNHDCGTCTFASDKTQLWSSNQQVNECHEVVEFTLIDSTVARIDQILDLKQDQKWYPVACQPETIRWLR